MIPDGCRNADDCELMQPNSPKGNFICGVVEGFYGRPWTSEQRKKLFKRMNKLGMNTYIYAPKDDSKHRMYWRELYTVEEAELLTALIEAAEDNGVTFVYALSPGLDMTYSSVKEVSCLKRKLNQVASFGCNAFALLFDDIEVDMCEADKSVYQSFASAQVSVTNEVYQHLHEPSKFFFCPTEYCASRAVPTVSQSEYLTTVGSKLLRGIDVMWTGPKVISRKITIKSIEEVAKVLQRPPLIWDNIHANDYDQKRIFLGPYDGRSPELIPYLKGVLTNPNCEFESNFVALHTLAQWSRSNAGGVKKDCILKHRAPKWVVSGTNGRLTERPSGRLARTFKRLTMRPRGCCTQGGSPVNSADIKLETDGEYTPDEDCPANSSFGYFPKQALKMSIIDWHSEFFEKCPAPRRVAVQSVYPVNFPTVLSPATLIDSKSPVTDFSLPISVPLKGVVDPMAILEVGDSYMNPSASINPVNGLLDTSSSSSSVSSDSADLNTSEPMDCIVTPGSTPVSVDSVLQPEDVSTDEGESLGKSASTAVETIASMLVDSTDSTPESFTVADVESIVDLFYLPFEHGRWAVDALSEFHWLKTNFITPGKTTMQSMPTVEWEERKKHFLLKLESMIGVIDRLFAVPNKAISYELFPYAWDIKAILILMSTFIQWLDKCNVKTVSQCCLLGGPYSWGNRGYGDYSMIGEREPWLFRGGLLGEFQRMLPFESCTDLLFYMCPELPQTNMLTIRPYTPLDKESVYEVCRRTCDDGADGTPIFPDHPQLIADRLVGAYLGHSSDMCFVVEGAKGVCGYVLASHDASSYFSYYESTWLPLMKEKYKKPEKTESLSPAEEIINEFYSYKNVVPESLLVRHPSIIRVDILRDHLQDATAPIRVLACAVAALKVAGSSGIFARIQLGDTSSAESYRKLGFFEIPHANSSMSSELVHMGRII